MIDVQQTTIVGAGLLGGSIGLALRARGYRGRIVGAGRTAATLEEARRLGCIDHAAGLEEAVPGSGLVILATPLGAMPALLAAAGPLLDAQAVVTDVGSTKQWICDEARRVLPAAARGRFVGAHPMAGAERTGPGAARPDLFQNRPCIVTPLPQADARAIALVEDLWRSLGMKVLRMSPAEHDQAVALISHLPHAVAAVLVETAAAGRLDLASTGFRDATRIASSDPEIWLDVFLTNREAILEAVEAFQGRLTDLKGALMAGDRAGILAALQRARDRRDRWVQKFETGED